MFDMFRHNKNNPHTHFVYLWQKAFIFFICLLKSPQQKDVNDSSCLWENASAAGFNGWKVFPAVGDSGISVLVAHFYC